jgi:methyl-accepting chemotaxis protein
MRTFLQDFVNKAADSVARGDTGLGNGSRSAAENAGSAGAEQSILAGQSIRSLAGTLTGSADTISAIESSSNQQVKGLEEISSSITGVQQTVLQNAESARDLENAALELHGLGNELTFLVSRFKIDK